MAEGALHNMNIFKPHEQNREDEHIYANETMNLDDVRTEDSDTKRNQTGVECMWIRTYKAATVCLGLLCIVLLVVCVKTNHQCQFRNHELTNDNTNLIMERDQFQTNSITLTKERDELWTNSARLTKERDELWTNSARLTKERDELRTIATRLTEERDELKTNSARLTKERDSLRTNSTRLTEELKTTNTNPYYVT